MLGVIPIVFLTILATWTHHIHLISLSTLNFVKWEMLYIVIVASILTVFCWNKGIKNIGPTNGVLFINFVPVTAFLIACLQGAPIEKMKLIGAALVVISLISNNIVLRKIGQNLNTNLTKYKLIK
jgi:drug/metabolite transporter (DMT)-like permease